MSVAHSLLAHDYVLARADDSVLLLGAHNHVAGSASIDHIGSSTAVEGVFATAAEEHVCRGNPDTSRSSWLVYMYKQRINGWIVHSRAPPPPPPHPWPCLRRSSPCPCRHRVDPAKVGRQASHGVIHRTIAYVTGDKRQGRLPFFLPFHGHRRWRPFRPRRRRYRVLETASSRYENDDDNGNNLIIVFTMAFARFHPLSLSLPSPP